MDSFNYITEVRDGAADVVETTHRILEECRKLNDEYNHLNVLSESLAIKQAEALKKNPNLKTLPLAGLPISVKDSICVKGVESTAGSAILKGYKPLHHATSVERAIAAGAIVIGKTAQDEFGFGSFSTNVGVGFKIPKNPFDKERACGGSSGGGAGLTQLLASKGIPHVSLGESTGGSIAEPASFCGVFGLCPTYGRVSRYGLIDYGNSLDKVGPMASGTRDAARVLTHISGYDHKDSTSANVEPENFENSLQNFEIKKFKIGVLKEALTENTDENVKKVFWNSIHKLEAEGATYEEVSSEVAIKHILPTYYILATAEASTNLSKFCGIRYGASEKLEGNFNDYFTNVRTKNLGEEAKRRIMLGTFTRMAGYRDAYYIKAMKVRTLLINDYKRMFKNHSILASPTAPLLPPKFSEIEKLSPMKQYLMDVLAVGPNLAGLPHINVPVGKYADLPIGSMFIGDHFQESDILRASSFFG